MGNCSSQDADRSLEEVDPPVVQQAAADEAPHPAPITVDLHSPPVDVSAALDERDIDLVQQTFARVATLGAETFGWVLFMNFFAIAPEAKELCPFKDEELATSPSMKKHAGNAVNEIATAVSLLRDRPTLVPVLQSSSLRLAGYGVTPAHYDVGGKALIQALGISLGTNMTEPVTNAYLKVFAMFKDTMISQCSEVAAKAEGGVTEEVPADAVDGADAAGAAPVEETAALAAEQEVSTTQAEVDEDKPPAAADEGTEGAKGPEAAAQGEAVEEVAEDSNKTKKVPPGNSKKKTESSNKKKKDEDAVKKKKAQDKDKLKKSSEDAKPTANTEEENNAPAGAQKKKPEKNAPKKAEDPAGAKAETTEVAAAESKDAGEESGAISKDAIKQREAAWKKLPEADQKKQSKDMLEAAKAGNIAEVTRALNAGCSVHCPDGDGWTPLLKAAEAGKADMIDLLLKYGADSAMTVKLGEWGNNALHHAARHSHTECVKILLAKGKKSDLAVKNWQGKTPRDYASDDKIKSMIKKAAKA